MVGPSVADRKGNGSGRPPVSSCPLHRTGISRPGLRPGRRGAPFGPFRLMFSANDDGTALAEGSGTMTNKTSPKFALPGFIALAVLAASTAACSSGTANQKGGTGSVGSIDPQALC